MPPSLEVTSNDATADRAPEKSSARLQILDPLAISNWDAQMLALPGYSFFHTAAWARVMEESYGFKPVYLAQTEGGQIRALLPMMEVQSWLTGKRGVSLPFTDTCDPLGAHTDALFEEVTRHGAAQGWKYWESRATRPIAPETPRFTSYLGHTLELSADEDAIFSGFDSSVRRAIRKSEKAGVTVQLSRNLEDVGVFYALHCQTRQKHGVPPQPFSFFECFHRHVIAHNLGFVTVARFEGRPIAASVFVHFGNKAIYKYGASDQTFQNLRGANLVMWHAIKWYGRAGFDALDFGRTAKSNDGLRRFKMGWGALEKGIDYVRFDLGLKKFVVGADESEDWKNRLISRMPIAAARLLGTVLYRHVA